MRIDIDLSFHIKWEYIAEKKAGYVWKESIPDW